MPWMDGENGCETVVSVGNPGDALELSRVLLPAVRIQDTNDA